jgi:hypothetical protein
MLFRGIFIKIYDSQFLSSGRVCIDPETDGYKVSIQIGFRYHVSSKAYLRNEGTWESAFRARNRASFFCSPPQSALDAKLKVLQAQSSLNQMIRRSVPRLDSAHPMA